MEQSELNKELYKAIDSSRDDALDIHEDIAANECERICLEKQIELLEYFRYSSDIDVTIEEVKQKLQQQLNQLKQ